MPIERSAMPCHRTRLSAGDGSFEFEPLRDNALLVTISGSDVGQFGYAALDEIGLALLRKPPLELFIDAEQATLVSTDVSKQWTQFFSTNRQSLKRVSVLTGSKLINLTVAIAQHLSQSDNLIQIYSDCALFERMMADGR
ncbi:hypothetical protein [Massilia endophytica]|uniref:hypothetical protein n=1 Tax=Massilia endophytica TaxID=2899220 RepID=UPI001E3C19AA|nr:hypothetical protein [Massilia endophytica]UGQ47993.1 hypothetical protein LSQ66_05875 [Massilia endophytica]